MSREFWFQLINFIFIVALVAIAVYRLIQIIPLKTSVVMNLLSNVSSGVIVTASKESLPEGKFKYIAILGLTPVDITQPISANIQFDDVFAETTLSEIYCKAAGTYVIGTSTYGIIDIGCSIVKSSSSYINTVLNFQPTVATEHRITIELIN